MSLVPAGSAQPRRFVPVAVDEASGSIQATWDVTTKREHGEKPRCVAEWLV